MSDDTRAASPAQPPAIAEREASAMRQHAAPTDALFQSLLESAPDAIVIVDDNGQIVIANSQAEHVFGYQRAELIGQPIELLLPERLHIRHHQHRTTYVGEPHTRPMGSDLDLAARRRDGSQFPVEVSLSPLQTEGGLLVTSVIRDITERKHAADELERQAQKFQALLESAPDAIVIVSSDGQIRIANSQAAQLFGYERAELIGQPIELLLPERLHIRHRQHRTTYIVEPHTRPMGSGLDLAARRRDGSEFPVEISLSPLETEDGLLITSVIRDITERKQVADELERQVVRRTAHLNALLSFSQQLLGAPALDVVLQRALSHALALAPEAERGAIYLYDPTAQRLALRASVGFSPLPDFSRPLDLGLIGRVFTSRQAHRVDSTTEWLTLAHEVGDDEPERLLQALHLSAPPSGMITIPLLAHDQAIGVLFLLRTSGAGAFAVEAQATLLALANLTAAAISEERSVREAATLAGQLAQLEEQQRSLAARLTSAEAAMLQAARLAAVGQLAASIAHEINNPLYAARNCLHLIEEDLPPELRDVPYLGIAREQLGRIAGIIERMRDFYRPQRGELAPCDLNALLEGTLALAGLNTRHVAIDVIFTPAADLPQVFGNADQLRQVFLNLILNAIDAMPNGGTLTVRTIAGASVAVVEIQDSGIGIPEEIRARLFEPFFTNKPNGTGLGLSISAHIVTQHGGQIEVESAEGHGSTFRVVLPYQPS
jgi:PAS domain S-box-containing protein